MSSWQSSISELSTAKPFTGMIFNHMSNHKILYLKELEDSMIHLYEKKKKIGKYYPFQHPSKTADGLVSDINMIVLSGAAGRVLYIHLS